jgi:hypothetical protein
MERFDMTNDELIRWAALDAYDVPRENLDGLIWIAKNKARTEVWHTLELTARQGVDMSLLSSYPGGLIKRKKKNG